MPGFLYSQSRRRYLYAGNGRAVPESRVRDALQSRIDASKQRVGGITEALIDGKIDTADWVVKIRDEIRAGHRAAAMLANGGKLDQSALGRLGAALRRQYDFLAQLASGIDNGEVALNGRLVARSKLYAQAVRTTYENQVRAREQRSRDFTQERRVLNAAAESCATCVSLARLGWQALGVLPALGESECRANCRCRFDYR